MKIEMTISPSYCPSWGLWEGIRECVQNYMDGVDQGYEGEIKYSNKDTLTFRNNGVVLTLAQMALMGEGSKAGTEARGEFAEGLKIGCMALVRAGHKVVIRTGNHAWDVSLEHSKKFDREVVVLKSRPQKFLDAVEVKIKDVPREKWEEYRGRFRQKENPISPFYGHLLTNEEDKGRIFVKDIWVCVDDELAYGYNFKNIKVDRDRKMIDAWNLSYHSSGIIFRALEHEVLSSEEVFELIYNDRKDVSKMNYHLDADGFNKLNGVFREKYGENGLPVRTEADKHEAKHFGFTGVICPQQMVELWAKYDMTLQQMANKKLKDVTKRFDYKDLDGEEKDNIQWVLSLVSAASIDYSEYILSVVSFFDENIAGTFSYNEEDKKAHINLARKILKDRRQLLMTTIEELAHIYGGDGTSEHKNGMHSMYADIILSQIEVSA